MEAQNPQVVTGPALESCIHMVHCSSCMHSVFVGSHCGAVTRVFQTVHDTAWQSSRAQHQIWCHTRHDDFEAILASPMTRSKGKVGFSHPQPCAAAASIWDMKIQNSLHLSNPMVLSLKFVHVMFTNTPIGHAPTRLYLLC